MTRDSRTALFLLSDAVGFVLLIACVNVANLMLARGAARQRELEIRRALGATSVRIIRQLVTESLMLALSAAVVGLLCARFGLAAIGHLSASHIPLQSRIGMDTPVLLSAMALSIITTMLFGLLPAWKLASGATGGSVNAGPRTNGGIGLQRALVIAEVALSIVPLACGGLMLRSFVNLLNAPLGFDPSNIVTAKMPVRVGRFPETAQRWALLLDVLDRVRAIPGVRAVSATRPLPLAPDQDTRRVGLADQPDALPILATQQVGIPGFLGVIGTPLREGRDFSVDDIAAQRDVAIIDEGLAKKLGKRLAVFRAGLTHQPEIIGVTGIVRGVRGSEEPRGSERKRKQQPREPTIGV